VSRSGIELPDPRDVLKLLLDGNQRWAEGRLEHPHQSVQRRLQVADHQDPLAVIFTCIDSRVPPEIIFDRGIGDLFVIRTGAHALDDQVVLGSIEFGPNGYEPSRPIVVLGHERCGAILAAIASITSGNPAPGHLQAEIDALAPAYDAAVAMPGDLVENMVRAQVRLTVERLKADPLIAALMREHGTPVVGGRYDLTSGLVEMIA
jgi:carbonic anhydrase